MVAGMFGVLMIASAGALAVVWMVADRTFESAHVRDRIDQTRCLFERTGRLQPPPGKETAQWRSLYS
jgi:hypothetical protein